MSDQHLIQRPGEMATPTARELATILFRQWIVFVAVSGVVLAATVLYIAAGNRYQAHMKILVRRGRVDAPVTGQDSAPIDLSRLAVTEEDLNSEVELLKDDEVLRTVAEDAGLAQHDWLTFLHRGEAPSARTERAARRLAGKLKVEPIKKTNLIAVSYSSTDPAMAAKVLRILAETYLQKHLEVQRPVGQVPFFLQQINEAHAALEQASQKLDDFDQLHRVVVAERERDLAIEKFSAMDASNRQIKIEIAATKRRIQELELQTSALPLRTTTQIRTADNPELLKELKSTLLELELKRTQLLDKYEPSHRLVQEIEQQIAETNFAIDSQAAAPVRDETTDKNPNYEWANLELQQARVHLRELEERAASGERQVAEYKRLSQTLGEEAIGQDDLVEARKAAQEGYLLYLKKLQEARIDDAMDQRGIVNVAMAERPVVPALPTSSAAAVLILGIFAAGAGGAGAAFTVDYLDPAFRTPSEVTLYLNAPVLASLPCRADLQQLSDPGDFS